MVVFRQKGLCVCDVADDDLPACVFGDSDIKSEPLQAGRTRTMSKLPGSSDSKDAGDRSVTGHKEEGEGLGRETPAGLALEKQNGGKISAGRCDL